MEKKIMKNLIALFILIICSGTIYSQKGKFEEALIVAENGETFVGKIAKKSDKSMSFQIDVVLNGEMKNFNPDDIEGFTIIRNGNEYRAVPYVASKSSGKSEKRFAKLLVDGDVKLYKLNVPSEETEYSYEPQKNRVYIIQKDSSFYTLSQSEKLLSQTNQNPTYFIGKNVYEVQSTYSVLKRDYLGILSYVLNDAPNISEAISKVGFFDKDMILIIEKYNQSDSENKPGKKLNTIQNKSNAVLSVI